MNFNGVEQAYYADALRGVLADKSYTRDEVVKILMELLSEVRTQLCDPPAQGVAA